MKVDITSYPGDSGLSVLSLLLFRVKVGPAAGLLFISGVFSLMVEKVGFRSLALNNGRLTNRGS